MTASLQKESRTAKVAIAVTPTEKEAVRVVAKKRGTDQSNLCREQLIADTLREYRELLATDGLRSLDTEA